MNVFKHIKLNPHPIFIDCGARLGHYSVNIRQIFPHAKIVAIEPNPHPLPHLKEQGILHNFEVCTVALSHKNSRTFMYDIPGNTRGTCFASLHKEIVQNTSPKAGALINQTFKFEVESQTLDYFLEANKIEKVDFLKLDCEGSEFEILRGASDDLLKNKISYIQFEFEHSYLKQGITLSNFKELLSGFELFRILPDGNLIALSGMDLIERDLFAFQNILCIRTDAGS